MPESGFPDFWRHNHIFTSFQKRVAGQKDKPANIRTHFAVAFTKGEGNETDADRKKKIRNALILLSARLYWPLLRLVRKGWTFIITAEELSIGTCRLIRLILNREKAGSIALSALLSAKTLQRDMARLYLAQTFGKKCLRRQRLLRRPEVHQTLFFSGGCVNRRIWSKLRESFRCIRSAGTDLPMNG